MTTAAQIRELFEKVKPEFQVTLCKKCKNQGTAFSWDIDVAAMVTDIGSPYDTFFAGAYTIPTLHIHATLASVAHEQDEAKKVLQNQQEADFSLAIATGVLILVIRSQNVLFGMNLDDEIQASEIAMVDALATRCPW
jgi:NAD-dependent SIR2 family protein deacetylase